MSQDDILLLLKTPKTHEELCKTLKLGKNTVWKQLKKLRIKKKVFLGYGINDKRKTIYIKSKIR